MFGNRKNPLTVFSHFTFYGYRLQSIVIIISTHLQYLLLEKLSTADTKRNCFIILIVLNFIEDTERREIRSLSTELSNF